MTRIQTIRTRWLNYGMEIVLALIVSSWIYGIFKENHFVSILASMVITGISFEVIFPKINMTLGKVTILALIPFVVGWILELGPAFSLIVAVYTTWRFTVHYQDLDYEQEVIYFLLTLVISLPLFYFYRIMTDIDGVLALLVVQFAFVLLLKINRMLIGQQLLAGTKSGLYKSLGILVVFVSLFSIGVGLAFDYIECFVFSLFGWIAAALSWVVLFLFSDLLTILTGWLANLVSDEEHPLHLNTITNPLLNGPVKQQQTNETGTYLFLALALLIIVMVGIRFYRKRLKQYRGFPILKSMNTNLRDGDPKDWQTSYITSPDNLIRKRMFQLSKYAARFGYGRKRHETLEEWKRRVPLPDKSANEFFDAYEIVRYGEKMIEEDQLERTESSFKQLKKCLKQQKSNQSM